MRSTSQASVLAAAREVEALAVAAGSVPPVEPTELLLRVRVRDPARAQELLDGLLALVVQREGEHWRGERWELLSAYTVSPTAVTTSSAELGP